MRLQTDCYAFSKYASAIARSEAYSNRNTSGQSFRTFPLLGHKGGVDRVAFSPDGETLVSGGADHTIRFWSVATSRQIRILRGHKGGVSSLVFSPNGQSLVSASRESVNIWDALPHRNKDILTNHAGWAQALALSPDGNTLVTSDFHSQALNLWDVPSRSFFGPLRGHTEFPSCMAISPDGKLLASGGPDKTVRLWDLSNNEPIKTHRCDHGIDGIGFSSDGTVLRAAGRGNLKFWDVASHQVESIRGELGDLVSSSTAFTVAFSPRGGLLTTAADDGRVVVWDANDGREVTSFKGETAEIRSVAFSLDEHLIAVGEGTEASPCLMSPNRRVFNGSKIRAILLKLPSPLTPRRWLR